MQFFDVLDSTNTYAKQHFAELSDGELIAAGEQTAGHGRLGRVWKSPRGNIFASFVIKNLSNPFLGVVASSLAALDLIRHLCPDHDFYIKWPNDIFHGRSKISGILSEFVRTTAESGLVVGIGINISLTEEDLAKIGQPAVSMFSLTGCTCDLMDTLLMFEHRLRQNVVLLRTEPAAVFHRWKIENALIGREVVFDVADGTVLEGTFHDIADDGSAVLHLADGTVKNLSCGDVRLRM